MKLTDLYTFFQFFLRAYLENLSSEVFGADIFKDDSTSYQLDDIGGNFFAIPGLNGKFNIVSKINVLSHFQVRITEKDLKKQNIDILDRICEESQNNCFHLQISKKNIMIRQKTGFFTKNLKILTQIQFLTNSKPSGGPKKYLFICNLEHG